MEGYNNTACRIADGIVVENNNCLGQQAMLVTVEDDEIVFNYDGLDQYFDEKSVKKIAKYLNDFLNRKR